MGNRTHVDELLRIDCAVRDGLAVGDGETIVEAARRIVAEHGDGLRVEAARAILEASPSDSWGGLKVAAAILCRGKAA